MGYKTNKLAINTDFSDDFNIDASGDVNIDGSLFLWGIEFKDTDEFTGLSDTPSSYSGQATSVVSVNTGGSGLEFKETTPIYIEVEDISTSNIPLAGTYLNGDGSWTSIDTGGGSFLSLSDTPSDYTGKAGYTLQIDGDASTLIFAETEQFRIVMADISALGVPDSSSYLRGDGTWATVVSSGGGAEPAGDDGDMQFNDNGDLGGSDLSYNWSTSSFLIGEAIAEATSKLNFVGDASDLSNMFKLTTVRTAEIYDPYDPVLETKCNYFNFVDILDGLTTSVGRVFATDMNDVYYNKTGNVDFDHSVVIDNVGVGTGIHIGSVLSNTYGSNTDVPFIHVNDTQYGGAMNSFTLTNNKVGKDITDPSNTAFATINRTPIAFLNDTNSAYHGLMVRGKNEYFKEGAATSLITMYPMVDPNYRITNCIALTYVRLRYLVSGASGTVSVVNGTTGTPSVILYNYDSGANITQIVKNSPTAYTGINTSPSAVSLIKYTFDSSVLFIEYLQ